MINLTDLYIKNFFSFRECYLDLSRPGLFLISGYDENGKDSNGSGKSTILNAICWALFGKTLKGVQGKDVVRWGEKDCEVILTLTDKEYKYKIIRNTTKINFMVDGASIPGNKLELQEKIESTFNTSYFSFIRSTSFSQGQVAFLGASTDAEKKKLFKDIFRLDKIDKLYLQVKTRYDGLMTEADGIVHQLKAIEEMIQNAENARLRTETNESNYQQEKEILIDQLSKDKEGRRPTKDGNQIREALQLCSCSLDGLKDVEKKHDDLFEARARILTEIAANKKETMRLWDVLEKSEILGQRCEVCGSIVNRKMLSAHKKELEDKIENLINRNKSLESDLSIIETSRMEADSKLLERNELRKYKENLERELMRLEFDWQEYEEFCKMSDARIEDYEKKNPYTSVLKDVDHQLDIFKGKQKLWSEDYEKVTKDIDIYAYLKWVLSKEGVSSFIIEESYGRLQYLSNKFLSKISNNNLHLKITPQRELKSGALREEIDIPVFVGSQLTTYWGLSDGQRSRVNIALLLALNKVCKEKKVNEFNFLLLDEVLDISLAEGGQLDVIDVLKEYLKECRTIIVISHKDTIANYFNYNIKVTRDQEGVSKII